ncbi:MAG: ferrous iron transport protein B [Eubacteriales bacterium]
MIFALAGNQNCGKTTLFNQLTGSNQHVGNFPGVTVEKKEGIIKRAKTATVVDLPGIYSLSPYTSEEVVTRDFLIKERPDCIINIVDATNIERNLYLTLQLIELNIPMVVALNMMDEVTASGGAISIPKLSEKLGVPVVPIAAAKNQGISTLIDRVMEVASAKEQPKRMDFCSNEVHRAIHSVAHLIEDHANARNIPVRFAATKLIEGDQPTIQTLKLNQNELDILDHITKEMETALNTDREAAVADMRYNYIESVVKETVKKKRDTKEQILSLKIDKVLTNKYLAIPIFLLIMGIMFYLTFDVLGAFLGSLMDWLVGEVTNIVDIALTSFGLNETMHSLIIDGIFAGVGSVLSFLPIIIVLFFFLSMLEDSGYMARVAFVMDKPLRKVGLSGRSFVPMLIGFGCSVPAIMATRTLASERDRKLTIMLTPFMSCSAKLPIYAVFIMAFFVKYRAVIMIGLYVLGMAVAVLYGLLLRKTIFKGNPVPFVMELPAYRLPSLKSMMLHMWEKAKDFIRKAFTIIFVATIVIWILQKFDFRFNIVANSSDSMLANIGTLLAPIFAPLGFGNWQMSTALVTGLTAKEAVISTLSILFNVSDATMLRAALTQSMSMLAAFSFLVFTLLYMPCVAAVAALRREMNSWWQSVAAMASQTLIAWIVAFIIYQGGSLLILLNIKLIDIIVAVVILIAVVLAIRFIIRNKGRCTGDCSSCPYAKNGGPQGCGIKNKKC